MKNFLKHSFFLFSLFSVALSAQDTVETIVREASANTDTASIHIRTNITGVEIFVNNVYKGVSPLTINDMVPATYAIQLRKDGWERKAVFVQLESQTETNLYFELIPITGFLRIQSNVRDADIYIDNALVTTGSSIDTGLIELQEGIHTVEIKKFGFESKAESVNIFERFLSEITFEMEKSVFDILSLSANPVSFNPFAPGRLGLVHCNFSVSAPGFATFEVLDKNNAVVYTEYFENFDKPNHVALWDGKDSYGNFMSEGQYAIKLTANPQEGWKSVESSMQATTNDDSVIALSTVQIDNSIFYPLTSTGAGGTALGVANVRLMPAGTTLFSVSGATAFSFNNGFSSFPFSASVVFTPFSILELSLRVGAEAGDTSLFPVFFGGSLKMSKNIQNAYIATLLRYTYSTEQTLFPVYSEPGLGFGFIGGIETGFFLFSLSEEVVFGSEMGNVSAFDGHLKSALGVHFQRGAFSSDAWLSLYSPFSIHDMHFFGMLEAGIDASMILPNTNVSPTIGCSYMVSEKDSHSIAVRFGFNIIIP